MTMWVRFGSANASARYGQVQGDGVQPLSAAPWEGGQPTGANLPLAACPLLVPVAPSKIVAVGLNYRSHAAELAMALPQEPLLFLKPPSSLIASGETILLPPQSTRVDYEGEIAVIIGRECRDVPAGEVEGVVAGYTLANDVTARDLQMSDGQWTRAKSFDTFLPLGPAVIPALPPAAVLRTRVNGELRQEGQISDLIFSIADIVSFVSGVMRLLPGDVILTGTPPGIGPLHDGDRVEISLDHAMPLSNPVRNAVKP